MTEQEVTQGLDMSVEQKARFVEALKNPSVDALTGFNFSREQKEKFVKFIKENGSNDVGKLESIFGKLRYFKFFKNTDHNDSSLFNAYMFFGYLVKYKSIFISNYFGLTASNIKIAILDIYDIDIIVDAMSDESTNKEEVKQDLIDIVGTCVDESLAKDIAAGKNTNYIEITEEEFYAND